MTMTMKTNDLIDLTTRITGIPEVFVRDAIETALLVIIDALAEDETVKLRGLGKFSVRRRLPMLGVIPGGELECSIKGPRVPHFSGAEKLQAELNLRRGG
ncbi:MAG: Integration host factor subunit beta [Candidatus Accumulibacter sp. BA-94]|nr:MAG: Integration host factor subunit beta [Candidatus Accumulibacter sp. BA-94]